MYVEQLGGREIRDLLGDPVMQRAHNCTMFQCPPGRSAQMGTTTILLRRNAVGMNTLRRW